MVDNASKTDAVSRLSQDDFEGDVPFRVVQEPEPGLSNARNKGFREATGEIVVFADDDVEVDRDWLAMLVGPFARGERVGATSGTTLPGALETPAQRWVEGFGGRVRGFETGSSTCSILPRTSPSSRSRSATWAQGETWPSVVTC